MASTLVFVIEPSRRVPRRWQSLLGTQRATGALRRSPARRRRFGGNALLIIYYSYQSTCRLPHPLSVEFFVGSPEWQICQSKKYKKAMTFSLCYLRDRNRFHNSLRVSKRPEHPVGNSINATMLSLSTCVHMSPQTGPSYPSVEIGSG